MPKLVSKFVLRSLRLDRHLTKQKTIVNWILYGQFGLRGEKGGVEESKVKLAENRLILGQFYSILPYFSSLPLNPNKPRDTHSFKTIAFHVSKLLG